MSYEEEMSPLSSQLSSHGSSEFGDDIKEEPDQTPNSPLQDDTHLMPSAKRRRIGNYSHQSTPVPHAEVEELGDISSDTEGSVPASPFGDRDRVLGFPDDEAAGIVPPEQVTVCKWKDCTVGDLGNMDNLVLHVHDDHIGKNKKRYACEWEGCKNKENAAHASGYALKAHMRSHTKEKPFYCRLPGKSPSSQNLKELLSLPECDRSFTRSDALAKHMRTVHETEALRPSDPVPKNYSSIPPKPQRLKLILNSKPREESQDNGDIEMDDDATIYANTEREVEYQAQPFEYPADVQFTDEELSMPPDQLFRLLRRQLHWAQEDGADLKEEVRQLEEKKRADWMQKELVLANLMEAELANASDRRDVTRHLEDLPAQMLPLTGSPPWYRHPIEQQGQE
ncbi:hypothetical protein MMC21_001588 [Puttea exsequens]|nr:hypothetical protein [Puttea exsequens]